MFPGGNTGFGYNHQDAVAQGLFDTKTTNTTTDKVLRRQKKQRKSSGIGAGGGGDDRDDDDDHHMQGRCSYIDCETEEQCPKEGFRTLRGYCPDHFEERMMSNATFLPKSQLMRAQKTLDRFHRRTKRARAGPLQKQEAQNLAKYNMTAAYYNFEEEEFIFADPADTPVDFRQDIANLLPRPVPREAQTDYFDSKREEQDCDPEDRKASSVPSLVFSSNQIDHPWFGSGFFSKKEEEQKTPPSSKSE